MSTAEDVAHAVDSWKPDDEFECGWSINKFSYYLATHIQQWYGERCPDHCETCIPCQMWAAYDLLTDNPFAGDDAE